jgi:alkanesulfonate monooxygenase SsuD/methylene tetrahydromethanopterin reductase-like flavin-dependent oxidoreductase (luciferase family)
MCSRHRELRASPALCGSPRQIINQIGKWRDALLLKFDGRGLAMRDVRASLERFAAHVAPQLQ